VIAFPDVALLPVTAAMKAIEDALLGGLDPAADIPRSSVDWAPAGQLLVMPSFDGRYAGVKLATVAAAGVPRIKGVYVLFDGDTLAPIALMDGAALTLLRTPAVSAVAARRLARPDARRLVVFGTGPQARAHEEALRAVLPALEYVDVVARGEDAAVVGEADVVCCCTTARDAVFDSSLLRDDATVIAVGSHEPGARELDERLMRRATVVVESRAAALREAGDVIQAGLAADDLVTIDTLVRGTATMAEGAPRVFKSVGMSWEDLVVAAALYERSRPA
jgi:ornithine cyclodeaminase/alanine dehydrogenase-like protein (mu-crystallin family)